MAKKYLLRHVETGAEYEIVAVDQTHGVVTLQGQHTQFNEPMDWERFKAMGYKRASVEVDETEDA